MDTFVKYIYSTAH